MTRLLRFGRLRTCIALAVALAATSGSLSAQQTRFLAKEDILVLGLGLRVEPAQQTVPRDIATIVSVYLQAPTVPSGLPPFAPDAEVRATLRGPSFAAPKELVTRPNTPFNIPPLTVAGLHTLENIRLISGGQVLLYGTPDTARIDVIDRLLVTQVTARPLTADEIRAKGIVFDKSSFQAYNFTAAFAVSPGEEITIAFPVVLPMLRTVENADVSAADLSLIEPTMLKDLKTLLPDTLKIQSRIPNLSVTGFSLAIEGTAGQEFFVLPIPGVIVIPGDVAFLNQFFSVMLMVSNVAPTGSGLVVSDLNARIVLPPGNDNVVGSGDDPLRMAMTAQGESPRMQLVRQPGADGKLGTFDDVLTLGPGETGNAEYLVEGLREGTHVLEMELTGTLEGLPVGPVPIRGRASGAVAVRNPRFTLTFTHPDVVNALEPYTLDITITNTSESPANFVSLNLDARNISGATLVGEPTRTFDYIAPNDSETVTFDLVANRSGAVTAATLDSDGQIAGRFQLKTAVGEFGVPLSPDSLVLPKEAGSLPKSLREAALGLLGRAHAVATAPAAVFPKDLIRFSEQIVLDRAVEVAEAGFRFSLGEPLADSAAQLLMDFAGSNYARLSERVEKPEDLPAVQQDYQGFDLLRRKSFRGDIFADAIASLFSDPLIQAGPAGFHLALATKWSYRPDHLSVLVTGAGGAAVPVNLVLVDAQGRELGGGTPSKVTKDIPFGEYLNIRNGAAEIAAQLAVVASPVPGEFTVRLERRADAPAGATYTVSIVYPGPDGRLHHAVFAGLGPTEIPALTFAADDPYRFTFALVVGGIPQSGTPASAPVSLVPDPPPSVLGVVQMADADRVGCPNGATWQAGRIVAVLFSEEVTPASVHDKARLEEIINFRIDGNRAVGVALQPDRRIAFIALREPIGPFVPRTMTVENVADRRGQLTPQQTVAIRATVTDEGGVVSGQVLRGDGTPVRYADVRLFYEFDCEASLLSGGGRACVAVGIAQKTADENGRFTWDYVLKAPKAVKLIAFDPDTNEIRIVRFTIARNGQRLEVNVVFLGRGTFKGRALAEDGHTPLAGTAIRITSLTDQSQYGTTADAIGQFEIQGIPVGNILVEAVSTAALAQVFISELIPFAGAIVTRDLVLLSIDVAGVTVQHGTIKGRVLRADGVSPVIDVPVIAYYQNRSQPGVRCPPPPNSENLGEPAECAIAVVRTDSVGAFAFESLAAGSLRVYSFDQAALAEGQVRVQLAADATLDFNVLLSGGLGTVRGIVVTAGGDPVTDARVGGGLSLTTVDQAGRFTLTDVPIGRRTIVAVSDSLGSTGSAVVDIAREGEVVDTTIVLDSVGSVAGIVHQSDGALAAGMPVYVFHDCYDGATGAKQICLDGQTKTDANGTYRVDQLRTGQYTVSSFRPDLADGNVARFAIRYHREVVRVDLTFRGGGGTVTGIVYAADGVTPLKARVSISGQQLVAADGRVGVGFEYVQNYQIVDTDITTGRFTLGKVWVGPFTVRAAGQFSPDPIALEGTMPSPGATVVMDLRLQPTSRVTGTLYQPDGTTPVGRDVTVKFKSEAFIVLCSEDEFGISQCTSLPQGIQEEFAVTDDQGRFAFPIVNAGTFTLTADDPGTGKVARAHGSVRAGETADVSMRLLGIGAVTVNVVGADGTTPISGASVDIRQVEYPNLARMGLTGPVGSIRFSGGDALTEGQFVVSALDMGSGFAGRASGQVSVDGEEVVVVVRLANATGTVSGTLFRQDGLTPAPNAEVVVSNASGPLAFAVTGADGAYSVALVPLGAFTVEAFDPSTGGRGRVSGSVDFRGQIVPANITLDAAGVIRGVVVNSVNRDPLKGWEVSLRQTTPSGRSLPELRTTTGVDGSYAFPGASVGTFRIIARNRLVVGTGTATGEVIRAGQVVEVPVVVLIERRVVGSVAGTVFNPDGTPAASAQVDICPAGEACRNAVAASDGSFAVTDVPLGRFTAQARAQVSGNLSAGTSAGYVLFEGDTAQITITLVGLGTVTGTVVNPDGTPAPDVSLVLTGQPSSGCAGACNGGTDAQGGFAFLNVPARTFTVRATDPVTQLKGSVGDTLNPGETKVVRIVLEPSGEIRGRALFGDGSPAARIVAELTRDAGAKLFGETGLDGTFVFDAVTLGPYTLTLQDPIGPGAARRSGTLVGTIDLGDIVLDEEPPSVGESTPAPGAVGVPLNQVIRITFTEPVALSTVDATTVSLTGPAGQVVALLDFEDGDRVVTLRPLSPLADQTRYTIRVSGVRDRAARKMTTDYVASFTTVDITPPTVLEVTPAPTTSGVTIYSTIRVKYSETIDPTKFTGAPVVITGPGGPVPGRMDYLYGATVAVFSPTLPLAEGAAYQVHVQPASDLAGNRQAQGLDFAFTTTDRTPPVIASLTPSGGGTVIENAVADVTATVAAGDVLYVDFYINDEFALVDRTAPFSVAFQAIPRYGLPGGRIRVTAFATDTSGNQSAPAVVLFTVLPDQPPTPTIVAPGPGYSARNGQAVIVSVRATDDLGVTQIGYKAATGYARDSATRAVTPSATDRTESFAFVVPSDVRPGPVQIEASAIDTKGQTAQASPISIQVLDGVAPVVTITGASSGQTVRPGQVVTAVVAATDLGGVTSIGFTAAGAAVASESRPVSPAQASAVTTFSFTVRADAGGSETVRLDAYALDAAGNRGVAQQLVLPVGDTAAPTAALRTQSGRPEMVPGRSVIVMADVTDDVGVASVTLAGTGAFTLSDARAVSPPARQAQVPFIINVPQMVPVGAELALTAQAFDSSGNPSAPATLTLAAVFVSEVTLPSSLILRAGETTGMLVALATPAGAAGVTVTFSSSNPGVVAAPAPVTFAEGENTHTVQVTAVSGGTAGLSALIQGVERATATITVIGGVVRGTIFNSQLAPVSGTQVTVFHAGQALTTTTDGSGQYLVEGVVGRDFTVRALEPVARLLGQASGTLDVAGGSAVQNVVLLEAGLLQGTVVLPDGATLAGGGVRLNLYEAAAPTTIVATTFTNVSSVWEFLMLAPGDYIVEASDVDGNRGRSTATITQANLEVTVLVAFLGRGTVSGTVRDGIGNPVSNAAIEFRATSVFGNAPVRSGSAGLDGTFAFDKVFVGAFTVSARDPVSSLGGSASGSIDSDGQAVTADISLAAFANLRGTVFRYDGVTNAGPGVSVTFDACGAPGDANCRFTTVTNEVGGFEFYFVPFRAFTVRASDAVTRGKAAAAGTFTTVGETLTLNLTFAGQGTLLVTVTDTTGTPVAGATVRATVTSGGLSDELTGQTNPQGVAGLQHLLAGPFVVTATSGGRDDVQTGTLASGEVQSLTLVVGRKRLTSIGAEPAAILLGTRGQTQQIVVTARYSDGSSEPLTSGVVFTSTDPVVASVSATGLVTAGNDGNATIDVSVAGVTSVQVGVTVRSIVGISINPQTVALLGAGKTAQLSVVATFGDGGTGTLTSGVTYESSDSAVATVTAQGLVRSVAPGASVVTAHYAAFTAQRTVTVTALQPVDIAVSPPGVSLTSAGQTVQLSVSYEYNDGTTGPISDPISFVSRDPMIATVDASGLVTAVANGTTQVDVTVGALTRAIVALVDIPVANPPPVITGLGRGIVGEDDTLAILGRNFDGLPANNRVYVNGVEGAVQSALAERLVAIVPRGAASGSVQVVTNGQASNTVHADVYPRRAQGGQITAPFTVATPVPGQALDLASLTVDVRQGDQVWLTGDPRTIIGGSFTTLPGPEFGGSLTLMIGGVPQVFMPSGSPIDLTPYFVPGDTAVTARLESLGGQLWSRGLSLVSGPPATGLFAGEWSLLGDGTPQQMTVRFRPGLPDGTMVAVTTNNWTKPDGYCCTDSAGGEMLNGTPTPNDTRFRTFVVTNGEVAVDYSDGTLVSQSTEIRQAVLAVVTADASGNKTANTPFTSATIRLPGTNSASVIPADVSLLSDGGDHPMPVRIDSFRDVLGYRVPDGSQVAVTVANWQKTDGYCCTDSRGGSISNGVTATNDSRFKVFTITGGAVEPIYTPAGLAVPEGQTWPAVVTALQATAANTKAVDRPYSNGLITLSGASAGALQYATAPPSLVATTMDNRSLVTITGFADAFGRPVPDGTKIALTTNNWKKPDDYCCTGSAGGTIVGGTIANNDSRFKVFATSGGTIAFEYSAQDLVLGPNETAAAVIVVIPADPSDNRIGDLPMLAVPIQLVGVAQATIVAAQSSVLADGVVRSVPVTVSGLRDALGIPVPDGTKIALTASNWTKPDGYCCTGSAGGTFAGGVQASNDSRFHVYTVTNGLIEAIYTTETAPGSGTGISLPYTDVRSAVFAAIVANRSDQRAKDLPFATGSITLSSTSQAATSVEPTGVLADAQQHLVTLTVSGIVDSQGRPVPDGTKVGVATTNWTKVDGYCCTGSAGGSMLGGIQAPNDSRVRVYEVQGGQFQAVYSDVGVFVDTFGTATAVMVLLPANGDGSKVGDRPFASASVSLAGFAAGTFVAPAELAPGGTTAVVLRDIRDALGNPVPDGTKIGLTSTNWTKPDGYCCTNSTPGTFLDGRVASNDSRVRVYTVAGGEISATFQAPAQANVTSVIVALPVDGEDAKRSNQPFVAVPITVK